MKKLINGAETVLEESLDGFAAAHADILLLGAERKFVRRRTLKPGKVALISGGGSGHEPLHAGFVGQRHARCRLPRPGIHLADAGPDDRGRRGRRHRRRRAFHRQELRRRCDELHHGRRDGRAGSCERGDERRRGGREIDLHDRSPRCRGYADRGKDGRRGGRERNAACCSQGARR